MIKSREPWDRQRTATAIVMGLAAVGGSVFSFDFHYPPHTISIIWSLVLPLLVALAYGWRYAIVSVVLGGAALFPFVVWPTNGWANLLSAVIYSSWFVIHGYAADLCRRGPKFWNNMYFVQVLCSLCYVALFLTIFPWLFSFNPPFWDPAAPSSIPPGIVTAILIKQTVVMFAMLLFCDILLNTHAVPRLLGLNVDSEDRVTSRIVFTAAFLGLVVVTIYFLLEVLLAKHNTSTFTEYAMTGEHIRTTVLILFLCMIAGLQFAHFVRRRFKDEKRLHESEQRYRTLFESAGDAIFLMQGERFAECNTRTLALFGYPREQIIGATPVQFSPSEQPDGQTSQVKAMEKINSALAGTPQFFEWKHVKSDGTLFDAEVTLNRVELTPGVHLQAIVRNVSARKRAEEEVRLSEEKLRLILENAPYAVYILSLEGQGLYVNRPAEKISGYSREELLGKHFLDIVLPEDRGSLLQRREARLAGRPTDSRYAFRIADKTGMVRWVENQAITLPWEGKPATLNFLQDITEKRKAEEDLLVKAQLLDNASDSIFLLDQDGRIVYANETACRSRGYSKDELLSMNIREINDPDDASRVGNLIGEVFDDVAIVFEAFHRSKNGTPLPIEVSARSLLLGDKRYILSINRDIAERKRAEAALKNSEEKFRKAFYTSPDAVNINRLADGMYVSINRGFTQILGYDESEVIGKTSLELNIWADPADRKRLVEGLTANGEVHNMEARFFRQQGEIVYGLMSAAIISIEGEHHVLSVTRDITEQKRAEDGMRDLMRRIVRSKKEWQETFDSITDMISIHDKDFNIIKANRAFSANLGLSPQEVINKKCYDLMHHGAASPIAGCPHQKTLREKMPVTEEVFDEMTNKTYRVTTYPYYSPTGEVIGSIHISRDITEEKEREMKMIMTERLASLGQMASGIAHEINNPLEAVMICAEMLLMRVAKDSYDHAQFEKYLKIIDEEVLRCRDITGNMLSFARQSALNKTDIDVQPLIDKTVDLVGYQGRLKKVAVIKKYGERFLVSGNEGEIRQVLLVLLINALDAMENKGAITIETGTETGSAWVRISDTGPGIATENIQKIFNPFFSTKTEKGGTGLGLSIAHRIIANHNGSLTVVSEQGHGAAFTATLPR